MFALFGGYAGDGKSTICAYLAATFSTGGILPDGSCAPVVNSLFLSAEEDPECALKPRLILHHAEHTRVFAMQGTRGKDGKVRWANLAADIGAIGAAVRQHNIGILWIDPLSAYLPGTDRNSEGDMRDAMSDLQLLMKDTGVTVVGIAHIGKGDGKGRRPEQRLLGSTAFAALARTVWMLADLPDEHQPGTAPDNPADKRKVFGVVKANYAIKPQSLVMDRPLDGPLRWLGPSPVSIAEAFEPSGDKGGAVRDAAAWLAERLAGGSQPTRQVEAAATDAGISSAALRRARATLNVRARKERSGEWVLSLPPGINAGKAGETVNALHNDSEPKTFTVNALRSFPEMQGKPPMRGIKDRPQEETQDGKAFTASIDGPLHALHNELLPPTGTEGRWEMEL